MGIRAGPPDAIAVAAPFSAGGAGIRAASCGGCCETRGGTGRSCRNRRRSAACSSVVPPLPEQRVDPIEPQAVAVFDQRHPHLRLEHAGEPADADLAAGARSRARPSSGPRRASRRPRVTRRRPFVSPTPPLPAPGTPRTGSRIVPSSEQRIAACACFTSSTGAPDSPGVVEQHADRRVDGHDRRPGHPAATGDARLAAPVLDDRAVVEHGEVGAFLSRAPERLPVGVAQRVHDLVLVDDGALQVGAPGAEHHVARSVEQEDRRRG